MKKDIQQRKNKNNTVTTFISKTKRNTETSNRRHREHLAERKEWTKLVKRDWLGDKDINVTTKFELLFKAIFIYVVNGGEKFSVYKVSWIIWMQEFFWYFSRCVFISRWRAIERGGGKEREREIDVKWLLFHVRIVCLEI